MDVHFCLTSWGIVFFRVGVGMGWVGVGMGWVGVGLSLKLGCNRVVVTVGVRVTFGFRVGVIFFDGKIKTENGILF